ncbi:hypothetical protein [Rufibacter sp. XAAS-G3-1]|uniref:hypothetical protein n=1 Tax=Rufibacter sp. XAAS-G3-1 TaxID=2729134 RepID=UPI0015E6D4F0|nr:hypothetical protein [Rufibacter sp. XAAS-G3-1]
MNIYDFRFLNQEERAECVYTEGTFLATNPERGNLYFVGDFYAEVLYDGDRNEIKEVTCFKSTNRLAPYLEHIAILKSVNP